MSKSKLVERPSRWETPFGPAMRTSDVQRLLEIPPFRDMDPSRFPASCSLHDILLNDSRVVEYAHGDLILREGDYGNSAFFILHGKVRVALESLPAQQLGRPQRRKPSLLRAVARAFRGNSIPEHRKQANHAEEQPEGRGVFLQDVPGVVDQYNTLRLQQGAMFGELAALTRTPRTATVFSDGQSVVLEMRWQGLRDIMRRAPEFRVEVDRLYRENSLASHLRATPELQGCTPEQLSRMVAAAEFESYGSFDWHLEHSRTPSQQRLDNEPVIAEEGHYPNGMLLIRSGFARLSVKHGSGHQTLAYLGKGRQFGLEELAYNEERESPVPYLRSLRAVGYVDVIRIPAALVEELVLPALPPADKRTLQDKAGALVRTIQQSNVVDNSGGANDRTASSDGVKDKTLETGLLEFLVESRLMNGTQALIMDLERCTRCDDCVRACEDGHDGNPRFLREGPRHGNYMFANACMHCTDPVCMIGCPTGAIARDADTGNVLINDSTCIGCQTCANSCPYGSIRMVEIRDGQGEIVRDSQDLLPILKATKCDLCSDQLGGPACQRACPHDALVRIDMQDLDALGDWMGRSS